MITNLKALCKLYIPIPTEDITVIAGYDTPQESPSQIHTIALNMLQNGVMVNGLLFRQTWVQILSLSAHRLSYVRWQGLLG